MGLEQVGVGLGFGNDVDESEEFGRVWVRLMSFLDKPVLVDDFTVNSAYGSITCR